VREFRFLPVAGLFALISAVSPPAVLAQSGVPANSSSFGGWEAGSFQVAQHGHAVGTATFQIIATPDGHDSTSLVRVTMDGLGYALSKNERLSSANQLEHAQLSATVNGEAVNVIVAPDSAQFLMNISASGRSTTTRLDAHPAAVLLPDFDPGALETLLALAAAQNNRDLWAILPKSAGSIVPVQLATYADQQGTLDGKAITVHHMVATIAGANTDLFSGPENQLLQAELPQEGFALIRNGFVLTPPAKPMAPPDEATPPPEPQA
jgi:hypothetical protein